MNKKNSMIVGKIEFDSNTVDKIIIEKIKELEKKTKNLEQKIVTRDTKIRELREGMDLTKKTRDEIKEHAEVLCRLLEDALWVDFDY